jgi:hypothetical protein
MNEHEIESLLSGLQPRGPSPALTRQVEHELELDHQWMHTPPKARRQTWFTPVLWSSLGAAAAVLVMSSLPSTGASPAQPSYAVVSSPTVMPVSTIREVVGAENEGIQYNADSLLPEQHVKLVSLERHAWIDPRDGAHITVERPREDSVVLPVSFQ